MLSGRQIFFILFSLFIPFPPPPSLTVPSHFSRVYPGEFVTRYVTLSHLAAGPRRWKLSIPPTHNHPPWCEMRLGAREWGGRFSFCERASFGGMLPKFGPWGGGGWVTGSWNEEGFNGEQLLVTLFFVVIFILVFSGKNFAFVENQWRFWGVCECFIILFFDDFSFLKAFRSGACFIFFSFAWLLLIFCPQAWLSFTYAFDLFPARRLSQNEAADGGREFWWEILLLI